MFLISSGTAAYLSCPWPALYCPDLIGPWHAVCWDYGSHRLDLLLTTSRFFFTACSPRQKDFWLCCTVLAQTVLFSALASKKYCLAKSPVPDLAAKIETPSKAPCERFHWLEYTDRQIEGECRGESGAACKNTNVVPIQVPGSKSDKPCISVQKPSPWFKHRFSL